MVAETGFGFTCRTYSGTAPAKTIHYSAAPFESRQSGGRMESCSKCSSFTPARYLRGSIAALLALFALAAHSAGSAAAPASAASAAGGDRPAARMSAACRDDALRLCANVEPGAGRVAACMRDKRSELSTDCKRDLKTMRAERRKGAHGSGVPGAASN